MVHVYHGDGKGKTTAAMGLAIRSAGVGNLVVIVQFLKGSPTGEIEVLSRIQEITVLRNQEDLGFVKWMTEEEKKQAEMMHNINLMQAIELINQGKCDLLVLDELASTYNYGLVDQNMVQTLLEMRPKDLEIVITGREPAQLFMDHADYITEMKKIRHPYDNGTPARKGVEF